MKVIQNQKGNKQLLEKNWCCESNTFFFNRICSHTKKKQVLKKKETPQTKASFLDSWLQVPFNNKTPTKFMHSFDQIIFISKLPPQTNKKASARFLWSTLYTSPLFTPSTCFLHRHNIPSIPTWCVDSRGLVVSEMQDPLYRSFLSSPFQVWIHSASFRILLIVTQLVASCSSNERKSSKGPEHIHKTHQICLESW